ncbi:MAG: alpha/beta hydrolase [Spirochaetae bacterium HGW-Spirochaetae-1]|nr:MAG: alpha/beta hydrolase [Spirochaetae bacterium HGW-Spirochaetae-1]
MKKIMVSLIAVIALIMFGAAWHFSSELINKKGVCDPDHFIYCGDPSELGLSFEDVTYKSTDGVNISAWYIPSPSPSVKGIIMVHGHGANRNEGMRWVKALHNAGFNLLLIDLRSHGKSTPGPISMGYHERDDVIAGVDYLVDARKLRDIGVFGVSMGAATSIPAMAADVRIKAGVFEAGIANFKDLLADIAWRDFHIPRYPLLNLVVAIFELRTGANSDEMNAEDSIKKIISRPVFIIHCEKDDFIPYEHGRRIYESANEPKQFWNSPCDRHARAWQGDTKKAERLVTEFYKKNI